jgi:hypothetical protein
VAVGLLVEEQRCEIQSGWKRAMERELGGEPALGFAVGPLLREMALALRGDTLPLRASGEGALRSAVLVRSGASPSRVAREFKLLHRSLWEAFRASGHVVGTDERRAADEWLDDALAAALERLERVRTRSDLLDRPPGAAPHGRASSARPPPLPSSRSPARPVTPAQMGPLAADSVAAE